MLAKLVGWASEDDIADFGFLCSNCNESYDLIEVQHYMVCPNCGWLWENRWNTIEDLLERKGFHYEN